MKILVVDDTPKHLEAARSQLATKHEVITASGYAEALDLMAEHKFDVILTDLKMPADLSDLETLIEPEEIQRLTNKAINESAGTSSTPEEALREKILTKSGLETPSQDMGTVVYEHAVNLDVPIVAMLSDANGHSFGSVEIGIKHRLLAQTHPFSTEDGVILTGDTAQFRTESHTFMTGEGTKNWGALLEFMITSRHELVQKAQMEHASEHSYRILGNP